MPLPSLLQDISSLLYPCNCQACGTKINDSQYVICPLCYSALPHTGFQRLSSNPAEWMFAGRLPIQAAHCEFYFSPHGGIRKLVHALKYQGNKEAGRFLGRSIGRSLMESEKFKGIQLLVPLPLFQERQLKRGYNQSEIICQGIHQISGIPIQAESVIRRKPTETQTKKHRTERWENVRESFSINDPERIKDKHILLVDDVITTGATLEACGSILIKNGCQLISIASAAIASK